MNEEKREEHTVYLQELLHVLLRPTMYMSHGEPEACIELVGFVHGFLAAKGGFYKGSPLESHIFFADPNKSLKEIAEMILAELKANPRIKWEM